MAEQHRILQAVGKLVRPGPQALWKSSIEVT